MRIAEVVANFPPYFGGIGNSCLRLSEGLMKQNNQVAVYTSLYPNIDYEYPAGLKVNRLKYQFKFGNAPLTLGLFKLKNTDVIHLHYPYFFGAEIIYIVSKMRKIPYVITYHMDMTGSGLKKYIVKFHKKLFLKLLMSGASRIYVSSYDYAGHSDLAKIKSIQQKIYEIPFGVDTNRFKPIKQSSSIRRMLHIKEDEQVIMFIGQLDQPHYFKGVPVLLNSFSKLDYQKIKLVIVGDGDLRNSFELKAKELGINKNVIFVGRVEDSQLNNYLSIANFMVLPSTDKTEAFGMVLLEAQSAGLAVIASNLPGVRTVVRNNKDGLLANAGDIYDLKDKMQKLLDNPSLSQKLGKNGRNKVEKQYTWDNVSQTLSEDINASIYEAQESSVVKGA